jgi:hypothetical protein
MMTFRFHLHPRLADGLLRAARKQLDTRLMLVLSDKIAETNTSFDAALGRVRVVVEGLHSNVADPEADVARGVATADELAALDARRGRIDTFDPTKPAIRPEGPAEVSSPTPEV